ncbi:MAG: avidin/streptavidin family protein [Thermodesulfobacteriota bacterium]
MAVDFSGKWFNQHGSMMDLRIDASGRVTGIYRTGVGTPKPSAQFDLVGFVAEDVIAFSVNFGTHGTLTSWVGQHTEDERGNAEIRTLWHLARNVPDADEPAKLWGGVWSGCDTFRRTEPAAAPAARVKALPSHPIG